MRCPMGKLASLLIVISLAVSPALAHETTAAKANAPLVEKLAAAIPSDIFLPD